MDSLGSDLHRGVDDGLERGGSDDGWGFVVFTIGAAAWIAVGVSTRQTQLLYSNLFLGLVDIFGIWRWLGRRARISDTSSAEETRSTQRAGENLFSAARLDGLPVRSADGTILATAVDALVACAGGRIDYLIVRAGDVGGVGETLYRLPWSQASVGHGEIRTSLTERTLRELPAPTAA